MKTTFDRWIPGWGLKVVGLVQDHDPSPAQHHHEACHVTSSWSWHVHDMTDVMTNVIISHPQWIPRPSTAGLPETHIYIWNILLSHKISKELFISSAHLPLQDCHGAAVTIMVHLHPECGGRVDDVVRDARHGEVVDTWCRLDILSRYLDWYIY